VELIQGVATKRLKVIPDERGRLMEMLRVDDPIFDKFGQVYLSTTLPGVVKGWHAHRQQNDCITCVKGMIKLVAYDARPDSPTHGLINEFFIGEHNPLLVKIPIGVQHGWKCVGEVEAYIINVVTEPYRYDQPDEQRVDPHDNDIPYDWTRRDG
jgi:dTDP-4-dehydrorhamnose 3,5-epimerase